MGPIFDLVCPPMLFSPLGRRPRPLFIPTIQHSKLQRKKGTKQARCRITHPVHAIGLVLPPYVCAPPRVSAEATPII
eukprot:scaffold323086_cov14-Tisochrysis_lutea.AAC.1